MILMADKQKKKKIISKNYSVSDWIPNTLEIRCSVWNFVNRSFSGNYFFYSIPDLLAGIKW